MAALKQEGSRDSEQHDGGGVSRGSPASSTEIPAAAKRRRCVSTACIACRKRKSKCDGAQPACAACVSVYNTQCIYDPSSDHRRKGVYKKDIDGLKTRNSTLQTLIQAILNYPEDDVPELVKKIRACESLDKVAEGIIARENGIALLDEDEKVSFTVENGDDNPTFESQLANKMGELRFDNGSVRMIGGTSNLLFLGDEPENDFVDDMVVSNGQSEDPTMSWTNVTSDPELIRHLLNHYFTWHYTFFTILPKAAFDRDFARGLHGPSYTRNRQYCSPVLVNAMLALGCHFSSSPGARADPDDSATAGDHFFNEAKRLIYEEDLLDIPRLTTVQALALMSVREAGCAREARGWVYSGMAFRMACDLGLSFNSSSVAYSPSQSTPPDEEEVDAKLITFWGCFVVDKCWSNYLGRLPIFQMSANVTVPKFEVFPMEDSNTWSPYSESGFSQANSQPSRLRAVALQISALCDISSDIIGYFYHPEQFEKPLTKQVEMKRLSEIHSRLEEWRRKLPKEFEPKEGILSSVIIMHMFFQVLYIHLFRPFLKYNQATSPLPNNVSPRKLCTQAAGHISKLLRLYKRSHGLRQIINIAVYITHSACTIHLLNMPEKNARRDITHGVKALEEIAEGWLCARRTLCVLSAQARKWRVELPEEASLVLSRTDAKFGALSSPSASSPDSKMSSPNEQRLQPIKQTQQQPSRRPALPRAYSSEDAWASDTTARPASGAEGKAAQYAPLGSESTSPYEQEAGLQTIIGNLTSPKAGRGNHQHDNQRGNNGWQQSQQSSGPSRKRTLQSADTTQMFGGVEALLREGQDWWMRDQSALASGFENWNYSSNEGSNAWTHNNGQNPTPQARQGQRHSVGNAQHMQAMSQPTFTANNNHNYGEGQGFRSNSISGSSGIQNDFNDVTGNNMNNTHNMNGNNGISNFGYALYTNDYNESDWYR